MDFATMQEAFRTACRDAAGVDDADVYWFGTRDASAWHGSGTGLAEMELRILSLASSGMDETRYKMDVDEDDNPVRYAYLCGNRRLVVQVKIEVSDQSPGASAVAIHERWRTRLRLKARLQALYGANLSVASIRPGVSVDRVDQGCMYSVWVSDVILLAAELDIPAEPSSTGWIERASGTLETDQGTTEFDTDGTV